MNTLTDGSILRALGVALERDEQNVAQPVAAREDARPTVQICAWCDPDQVEARALMAQGKRVSHTCCNFHTEQQLARAREMNRQAAGGGARRTGIQEKEAA